jgi:hypothetical protein
MIRLFLVLIVLSLSVQSKAQGLTAPSPGKAVVYFCRPYNLPIINELAFFDSTQFIGKFTGSSYTRYECDPGRHLLWSKLDNKRFIEADLEAGGIYIIQVKIGPGLVSGTVNMEQLGPDDTKSLPRILNVLKEEAPHAMTDEEMSEEQIHFKKAIDNYPKAYEAAKKKKDQLVVFNKTITHSPQ